MERIENLRVWMESETGMDLTGPRVTRLHGALERVLGKAWSEADATVDAILACPARRSRFLEELVSALTVGESFFLRNEYHFRALREHVIPNILNAKRGDSEMRIWTAGCATGEEPYSLAILLDQMVSNPNSCKRNREINVSILATDLNLQFLATAREGLYRQWSFRQTDIHNDPRYFSRETGGKTFRLVPRIRRQVHFAYLNLVKDVYPSPLTGTLGLDLILFRNVAIYLKPEVTQAILQRMHRALRPGGWLLLGETEVTLASSDGFEVRRFDQATFFQKQDERDAISDTAVPIPAPVLATVPFASDPVSVKGGGRTTKIAVPAAAHPVPGPHLGAIPEPVSPEGTEFPEQTSVWEQVERSLDRRDFHGAERAIDRMAGRKNRAAARLRFSRALLSCSEVTRARQMLDRCLAEDPLLIEAQLLKAVFAEEAGDLADAEQSYRRALYIDRNSAMAHFHLALVQRQQGDVAGARRSLEMVEQLVRDKEPKRLVEHGDGMCYGRLREMAAMILDS